MLPGKKHASNVAPGQLELVALIDKSSAYEARSCSCASVTHTAVLAGCQDPHQLISNCGWILAKLCNTAHITMFAKQSCHFHNGMQTQDHNQ